MTTKQQLLNEIKSIDLYEYFYVLGLNYNIKQLKNYLKDLVGEKPYKVGDWIDSSNQHEYTKKGVSNAIEKLKRELYAYQNVIISDAVRVYRTTKKSYWIEIPVIKIAPEGVSNWKWANTKFSNLQIISGCDTEYQHEYEWYIPYEGNEDAFDFIQSKTPIKITEDDIKLPKHTKCKGYRFKYNY